LGFLAEVKVWPHLLREELVPEGCQLFLLGRVPGMSSIPRSADGRPFFERECLSTLAANFSLTKDNACASMTLNDLLYRRGRASQVMDNRLVSLGEPGFINKQLLELN
jgi:hypothetical protein